MLEIADQLAQHPGLAGIRHPRKSDPVDAVEAARAVLSGRATGSGKTRDGNVEAIRALTIAKRSARSTKIKTCHDGLSGLTTAGETARI